MAPPLITISVVLCQESIPLQDPMAGWKANYRFWLRVGLFGVVLGALMADFVKPWLDVPALSSRQKLACSACVAGALVVVGISTSALWAFPVPFFTSTLLPSVMWVFQLLLCAMVGIRRILSRRDELRRLSYALSLLGIVTVGYPAFQVLFDKTNHTVYEIPVLLLLPAFRIVTKRVFALVASHKWDIVPEHIVFTVDFFDALYLATCLPSLSAASLGVILAVDIAQTGVDLLELHQRTQNILTRLRMAANLQSNGDSCSLLSAVRLLCYNPELLGKQGIEVRSCIPHQLPHHGSALLEKLEKYTTTWAASKLVHRSSSRTPTPPWALALAALPDRVRSATAVHPHPAIFVATKQMIVDNLATGSDKESCGRSSSIVDSSDVLLETLEVLFTAECLILTEYLEVIVPVLYGTFMFAMTHLPNAQYHTEMVGVTRENVTNMVAKNFINAVLELLSFVLLAVIMKRNCGIDAFYQLAFVLQTQMQFVLSKLIL